MIKVMPAAGQITMLTQEVMRRLIQPKRGELALILADSESDSEFVQAVASAVSSHGAEPIVMVISPTFLEEGQRFLPSPVIKALEDIDIYFPLTATTGHSVHSTEIAAALYDKKRKKNIRMFIFGGWYGGDVGFALEALRLHNADKEMEWGLKFCKYLNGGSQVHLTSDAGTDFTASIKGITFRPVTQYAKEPGQIGGTPEGEAYGGPLEFTGEGVIALDGPISTVIAKPKLDQPILVTIKKGRIVDIKGGPEAELFRQFIAQYKNADVLAEVSLGTNPFARHMGLIDKMDKKILGTAHVAFGLNTMQIWPHGTNFCPVHIDCLLLAPSFWVDGKQLLDKGKPIV